MAKTAAKPIPQPPRDLIRSWDAFDRLFEEAFAPQPAPLDNENYDDPGMSSAEEEYQRLAQEAMRVKRTKTTTRRRTFQKGTMPLSPEAPYQTGSMIMSPPAPINKGGDLRHSKSKYVALTSPCVRPSIKEAIVLGSISIIRRTRIW